MLLFTAILIIRSQDIGKGFQSGVFAYVST